MAFKIQIFRLALVLITSSLYTQRASGTITKTVATQKFDGVVMYAVVDRNVVEQRVYEFNHAQDMLGSGRKLFMPSSPVFPGILTPGQYVVFIGIGHDVFDDYKGYAPFTLNTRRVICGISIPFLSDSENGLPEYALTVGVLYDRNSGEIGKSNFAFPYLPVDDIYMDDSHAVIGDGYDRMVLSFTRYTNPCLEAPTLVRHERDSSVDYEMQIGSTKVQFDICDRYPADNPFCSVVGDIRQQVSLAGDNVCQLAFRATGVARCAASVEIMDVTPGFRELMLLPEGPIGLIAEESITGTFPIGLKYPCIE